MRQVELGQINNKRSSSFSQYGAVNQRRSAVSKRKLVVETACELVAGTTGTFFASWA